MRIGQLAIQMTIGLGLVSLLSACDPPISEPIVLAAMEAPLLVLGVEVQRIDDEPLTAAYRDVAATWLAGMPQ